MEMNRAEIDAIYDAAGRLVVTPNAVTVDGQRNVPVDLHPGESLAAFLERHVDGIHSGAWTVSIGGATVPAAMWAKTYPKHGMHIACRAMVGKQVLALVAIAVLTYFSGGLAAGMYGAMGGTYVAASAGIALSAIQAGIVIAGSMLINKVLGPKVSTPASNAQKQVYSLGGQRNSPRPYEPIPVLWGEMRVTPDLASQPYNWYEGDNQYLSTILLGGINVHTASDLAVGDTPISSYSDVSVFYNGFPGMASQDVPLYSNADSTAGGELVNGGDWLTRTGSVGAVGLQVDLEGQLYDMGKSSVKANWVELTIEFRRVGAPAWTSLLVTTLRNETTDAVRRTFSFDVAEGQYEVRTKLGIPYRNDGGSEDACKFAWTTLRSIQPDNTDYSGWGRIGIKIKATGQLSGSLDTLRATYRAKPIPVWNGMEWVTATTRENGLSNPGAILLQTLRGVYANGVLQFGFGLSDEQIDIEGLKAFMLHCAANGFMYDKWVTSQMSLGQFCQEVALAGMGEFAWTDGSRPTAVFVSAGQPISAVVNMANMGKASFSVDYALSNTADGIEYQYLDRETWEMKTLRVMAPGVTTMLNPARVTGEGVSSEAHAAILARYHLAQSLYQFKTIGYSADIEHLDYRRLSIVSVSHDLTQWGYGGRLVKAEQMAGKVRLTLDEPVPPLASAHVGLRVPGARDYRTWQVVALSAESDVIDLVGEWPAGVAFPGATPSNPAHDTLWCYDFKATPGYRVRVTSMEPEGDLKGAKITCVPEGPEFWDYVLNGSYVPAPNQSSIPQLGRPAVKNLRVTERINLQGDTEWYELDCVWDVEGEYDHAQVWAGRDGSELRLVDGNATGSRSTFRIDGAGEWLIEVKPFNASGQGGVAAVLLYITTQTQLPPRNVDQFVVQKLAGGLRRFAWAYTGDKPPAFAGVQIRYLPGDVALSTASWETMQPLGDAGDIYSAQFETTKPQAGQWTFGCRAIDTAGQLSNGIMRFAVQLDESFEQVQQPDMTPPPAPSGLAAVGGLSTVQVSWDVPLYTQGHGHARTDVWAGPTADRATAKKAADGYAGPVSFTAGPAQTLYVWARHMSVDGVSGPWAGPVVAATGEDVAGLLDVLKGKVDSAQLAPIVIDRIKTIDLLDMSGGPLGRSVIDAISAHDTASQIARQDLDTMADGLLQAAIAADRALERIADAGIYVDPATGTVKIYGLEQTQGQVTDLQIVIDAVKGQLQLKATTAYVDGKIAEAVLSPADLLLYQGLDARIVSVTQTLDSINGTLTQKASALSVQQAVARLTTAENALDALSGQISLRVTRAEYEANRDLTETRLQSAELQIGALDAPSIAATVQAFGHMQADVDENAASILRGLLAQDAGRVQLNADVAFARTELNARMREGFEAEAVQRTAMLASIGAQQAALLQESLVRASSDAAEAQARQQLEATVQGNNAAINARVDAESAARADALSAEARRSDTVIARVESNQQAADDALAESLLRGLVSQDAGQQKSNAEIALARSEVNAVVQAGLSAEATRREQLAAQLGQQQAQIVEEARVRATAVSAEATKREQLATAVETNRQQAISDVDQAKQQAQQDKQTLQASITQVSEAASTAVAAEAQQRGQLAAVVESNQRQVVAAIEDTKQASATADAAQTQARQTLAAQVQANRSESVSGLEAAFAAISTEQSVRAEQNGYQGAQYSIKMQLGQGDRAVVGGVQMTGTSSATAGPVIDFGVLANKFFVAAPADSGIASDFQLTVQTAPATVNGVVVPAGLYVDAAYISNVTVLWGRFGNLVADSIQATAISASQLTAGNGVIGGTLKSANYVSGSSGWTLRPDGVAEFSGVIVRGTVYASAGNIGGLLISGGGINGGSFTGFAWPAGTGTGFHLGPSGLLLGNLSTGKYLQLTAAGELYAPGFSIAGGNARFAGELAAASGSFTGSLQGAGGTFAGTLTAQNVVVTGNLEYNAATVPLYTAASAPHTEAGFRAIELWTPAFDAGMLCVLEYGYLWSSVSPAPVNVDLRVDGLAVLSIPPNIGAKTDGDGTSSEGGCFSYSFAFSGNGLARLIQIVPGPLFTLRHRFIKAVIHKR